MLVQKGLPLADKLTLPWPALILPVHFALPQKLWSLLSNLPCYFSVHKHSTLLLDPHYIGWPCTSCKGKVTSSHMQKLNAKCMISDCNKYHYYGTCIWVLTCLSNHTKELEWFYSLALLVSHLTFIHEIFLASVCENKGDPFLWMCYTDCWQLRLTCRQN